METDPEAVSILRLGRPGEYFYQVIGGRENFPVTYVSEIQKEHYSNWFQNKELTDDIKDGDLLLKSNGSNFTMSSLAGNQLLLTSVLQQKSDNAASSTLSTFEEVGDICLVIGGVFLTKTMMEGGGSGTPPLNDLSAELIPKEEENPARNFRRVVKKVAFTLPEADQEKTSDPLTVERSDLNGNEQQLIENQNRLRALEAQITAGTSQQSIDLLRRNANLRVQFKCALQEGGLERESSDSYKKQVARELRIDFLKKAAASCIEAAKEAQKPDLNQQVVDLLKYSTDLYEQAATKYNEEFYKSSRCYFSKIADNLSEVAEELQVTNSNQRAIKFLNDSGSLFQQAAVAIIADGEARIKTKSLRSAGISLSKAAMQTKCLAPNKKIINSLVESAHLYEQSARVSDTDLDNAKSLAQEGNDLIAALEEVEKNENHKELKKYHHNRRDFTRNSKSSNSSICNIM
ncbi:MAG: hypothetical protein ACH346_06545 [Chthoniobacterales bacterium]